MFEIRVNTQIAYDVLKTLTAFDFYPLIVYTVLSDPMNMAVLYTVNRDKTIGAIVVLTGVSATKYKVPTLYGEYTAIKTNKLIQGLKSFAQSGVEEVKIEVYRDFTCIIPPKGREICSYNSVGSYYDYFEFEVGGVSAPSLITGLGLTGGATQATIEFHPDTVEKLEKFVERVRSVTGQERYIVLYSVEGRGSYVGAVVKKDSEYAVLEPIEVEGNCEEDAWAVLSFDVFYNLLRSVPETVPSTLLFGTWTLDSGLREYVAYTATAKSGSTEISVGLAIKKVTPEETLERKIREVHETLKKFPEEEVEKEIDRICSRIREIYSKIKGVSEECEEYSLDEVQLAQNVLAKLRAELKTLESDLNELASQVPEYDKVAEARALIALTKKGLSEVTKKLKEREEELEAEEELRRLEREIYEALKEEIEKAETIERLEEIMELIEEAELPIDMTVDLRILAERKRRKLIPEIPEYGPTPTPEQIEELRRNYGQLVTQGNFEAARILDRLISRIETGAPWSGEIESMLERLEKLGVDHIKQKIVKEIYGRGD